MRVEGNQGKLLSTMVVVFAAVDEDKDYLEFFMPFVADRLKGWQEGRSVEPHELSSALCEEWGFPSVPSAVSKVLLQRAQRDGLVRNVRRAYFPNRERLLDVPDLTEKKQEMLAELNALTEAVVGYARDVHDLKWSEERAGAALERLTEEFGAELATAKREGGLSVGPSSDGDAALAVVYGFARRALERDPLNFNRLVAMVQGAMIANALYFEDLRKMPNRLPELRVYLDTAPVLRGLGFACPSVVEAAQEMLALMRSFKIPMFVFSHTVDEITAILECLATSLRRGTQEVKDQGRVAGPLRESVDAAIEAGMTVGDVRMLIANLESRLAELGVRTCETPRSVEADQVDDERLAAILRDRVSYREDDEGPLQKDVDSLAAIDRLRGSTQPRELAQTRAVFVTHNDAVSGASRQYFHEQGRDAPIPHCMTDVALTAQLWVVSRERKPDLPRRLLIADCFSALAPSPQLWERWVLQIIKLRQSERITEGQLLALIYNQQIRSLLYEVARDDPENVNDHAVADVLERYEATLRGPAEQAAREARSAAEAERQQLLAIVERLEGEWRQQQASQRARRVAKRLRCRLLARRVGGFLAMAPIIAAFATLAAAGMIQGRAWWATSVTLLIFSCASTACWGLRKGWKAPVAVLIAAGAMSTLWANVFGVVPEPSSHAKHAGAVAHQEAQRTGRAH